MTACFAGCDKFCSVQVWTSGTEGVADNVRSCQDVSSLPESLEA